jgi:hypothetical protein
VRGEISTVKSDLEKRISEVKEESHKNQASTIRWMFVFWVGQIGAMLGILFAFFSLGRRTIFSMCRFFAFLDSAVEAEYTESH